MNIKYIIDTGPLVAYINKNDRYHTWAKDTLSKITYPPLLTCESVISEACFLLRKVTNGRQIILELMNRGLIKTDFELNNEAIFIKKLITKYKNIPMSLADACLVRMSEQYSHSVIITLDSDFTVYRKHNRQQIALLSCHPTN